jgi:hypothetical protein
LIDFGDFKRKSLCKYESLAALAANLGEEYS